MLRVTRGPDGTIRRVLYCKIFKDKSTLCAPQIRTGLGEGAASKEADRQVAFDGADRNPTPAERDRRAVSDQNGQVARAGGIVAYETGGGETKAGSESHQIGRIEAKSEPESHQTGEIEAHQTGGTEGQQTGEVAGQQTPGATLPKSGRIGYLIACRTRRSDSTFHFLRFKDDKT